jgi:hypothetical protein
MSQDPPELDPSELVVVAGYAGGVDPRTVGKYLDGGNTKPRKRRAIERALRALGMGGYVRRD